jgi:hypothetical protein
VNVDVQMAQKVTAARRSLRAAARNPAARIRVASRMASVVVEVFANQVKRVVPVDAVNRWLAGHAIAIRKIKRRSATVAPVANVSLENVLASRALAVRLCSTPSLVICQ